MRIHNKEVFSELDIANMFNVKIPTVKRWYKKGLKHFHVNDVNYTFEDDLEAYFKGV